MEEVEEVAEVVEGATVVEEVVEEVVGEATVAEEVVEEVVVDEEEVVVHEEEVVAEEEEVVVEEEEEGTSQNVTVALMFDNTRTRGITSKIN